MQDVANNPNFKIWFGSSKTVDELGMPLVFYHRSRSPVEFTEFKHGINKNPLNNDYGFYFTAQHSKQLVQHIAQGVEILAYLRICHPFMMHETKPAHMIDHYGNTITCPCLDESFCKNIMQKGHDGIIIQSSLTYTYAQYIVFDATQIKHKNNNGNYCHINPNMYE